MAFDNAEHHRESQARPVIALCCEERLEATFSHFRAHPDAGVDDVDNCVAPLRESPQGDDPSARDGIQGIENQVCEDFAQFGADARGHELAFEIGAERDCFFSLALGATGLGQCD